MMFMSDVLHFLSLSLCSLPLLFLVLKVLPCLVWFCPRFLPINPCFCCSLMSQALCFCEYTKDYVDRNICYCLLDDLHLLTRIYFSHSNVFFMTLITFLLSVRVSSTLTSNFIVSKYVLINQSLPLF